MLSCYVRVPQGSLGGWAPLPHFQNCLHATPVLDLVFRKPYNMDYVLRCHVCLAGCSSFNVDKRVFATSHEVNVTEVSSCQCDILQNQNKTKHNLTIGNIKM